MFKIPAIRYGYGLMNHSATCLLGAILLSTCPRAAGQNQPPAPVIIQVSDCKLADKPLETKPAREILSRVVGDELEAIAPVGDEAWVTLGEKFSHPFLAAAHLAFADHRPLALSPDMIWQLLIQQACAEIHRSPEDYRKLLGAHEYGKRTLTIQRDQFIAGKPDNDWPGVFAEFESLIIKQAPDSPVKDFAHRFSTSSPTDISVRQVQVLDAASDFYIYHVATLCGIPRIELHGSSEDWRWLRDKAQKLKPFKMERRLQALAPVLDEFVAASEGKANPDFWKSFYKFSSESGSSYVSGWVNLFFAAEDSKLLELVLAPDFSWATAPIVKSRLGARNLPLALSLSSYSNKGPTRVDFTWQHFNETWPMRIEAGLLGVAQDPTSLTLRPVSAWRVSRVKIAAEEQAAANMLGGLKAIDWDTKMSIRFGLKFDPASGRISLGEDQGIEWGDDSRFWCKAFPLMRDLRLINTSQIINPHWTQDEIKAVCTAMLAAPSVTKVMVAGRDFDSECLKILKSRKDWKVEIEGQDE